MMKKRMKDVRLYETNNFKDCLEIKLNKKNHNQHPLERKAQQNEQNEIKNYSKTEKERSSRDDL